ncbi:MAG: hypothetical protein MHMPM18_000142 [Marteilia pararefringens]
MPIVVTKREKPSYCYEITASGDEKFPQPNLQVPEFKPLLEKYKGITSEELFSSPVFILIFPSITASIDSISNLNRSQQIINTFGIDYLKLDACDENNKYIINVMREISKASGTQFSDLYYGLYVLDCRDTSRKIVKKVINFEDLCNLIEEDDCNKYFQEKSAEYHLNNDLGY